MNISYRVIVIYIYTGIIELKSDFIVGHVLRVICYIDNPFKLGSVC